MHFNPNGSFQGHHTFIKEIRHTIEKFSSYLHHKQQHNKGTGQEYYLYVRSILMHFPVKTIPFKTLGFQYDCISHLALNTAIVVPFKKRYRVICPVSSSDFLFCFVLFKSAGRFTVPFWHSTTFPFDKLHSLWNKRIKIRGNLSHLPRHTPFSFRSFPVELPYNYF